MGWLSGIFRSPFSGRSRKGKRVRRPADGSTEIGKGPDLDSSSDGEARPAGDEAAGRQSEHPAASVTAEDIADTDAAPALPVLMESGDFRTSSENSLKQGQVSLQQHHEAQVLRERSQSVFALSESIMEEAIRSVENVGRAYEEGLAADSAANMEAISKARKMAETLRSRLENDRSVYRDALGRALGMNEKATRDLVAALDSMNSAVMNVAQELEASARTSAMADASKESALKELLAVQVLWNELASLRQEFLARPDPEPAPFVPAETIEGAKQARPATELEEPYVLLQELSTDGAALLAPGLTGQEIEDQVLDAARSETEAGKDEHPTAAEVGPPAEPLTGDPALDLEIANAQAATDFPGSAGASAAEALRREMAGLAPLPDAGQAGVPSPDPAGAEREARVVRAPEPVRTIPAAPAPEPIQSTPAAPVASTANLARSYTGRVYLMFDATLNQETLELVWDAVEEASDSGVIVDTRLVSREEGVQMTLDVDGAPLDVAALLQRLPGAELAPIAEDRIRVVWTPEMRRN